MERFHKLPVDSFGEIPFGGEGLTVVDLNDRELFLHIWPEGIELVFADKDYESVGAEDSEFFTYDELLAIIRYINKGVKA